MTTNKQTRTLQIKQYRPDAAETGYFWKLFHAAQRIESRWYSDLPDIAAGLSECSDMTREQKLFLLRAWQVLVDDKGGFGRFMGAFDTYIYNVQDPDERYVAYKPELKECIENGNLFDIVLEAYQEARMELEAAERRNAELAAEFFALPPLNDDLIAILGRPNFTCAHLAELLRNGGQDIRRKSEHEQAAVIYWFLGLYLIYGDKWESIAKDDIRSRAAVISPQGE